MAYHQHLHQAFLDVHYVAGRLAGTWRNPYFGGKDDAEDMVRAIKNLRSAVGELEAQLETMQEAAE